MDYKKLVSIVGKPGLYIIVNQRPDGLIAKPIEGGKTSFVSSRLNQFTLLENISIYTNEDVELLYDILQIMNDKEKDLAVPDKKSTNEDLKAYFNEILPDYDKEKVYVSDIKKIIKWYSILKENNIEQLLKDRKEDNKEAEAETEGESKDGEKKAAKSKKPATKKPTPKKTVKASSNKKASAGKKAVVKNTTQMKKG